MYMWLFTWVTNREVTVYASGAPEFAPGFCGVRVDPSFVFCVVFCWSLFALSLLAIVVLSVFWFANSDYISMFNLFILWIIFFLSISRNQKNKSFAKYSICSCFLKEQILSSNWYSWHKCIISLYLNKATQFFLCNVVYFW